MAVYRVNMGNTTPPAGFNPQNAVTSGTTEVPGKELGPDDKPSRFVRLVRRAAKILRSSDDN